MYKLKPDHTSLLSELFSKTAGFLVFVAKSAVTLVSPKTHQSYICYLKNEKCVLHS